jgi:hypothetical protein
MPFFLQVFPLSLFCLTCTTVKQNNEKKLKQKILIPVRDEDHEDSRGTTLFPGHTPSRLSPDTLQVDG